MTVIIIINKFENGHKTLQIPGSRLNILIKQRLICKHSIEIPDNPIRRFGITIRKLIIDCLQQSATNKLIIPPERSSEVSFC